MIQENEISIEWSKRLLVAGVGTIGMSLVKNMSENIRDVTCISVASINEDITNRISEVYGLFIVRAGNDVIDQLIEQELIRIAYRVDALVVIISDIHQSSHELFRRDYLPEGPTIIYINDNTLDRLHRNSSETISAQELQRNLFLLAVMQITDLITYRTMFGIDFVFIKSILGSQGGRAWLGIGYANGPNGSGGQAAQNALNALSRQGLVVNKANGMIVSIYSSGDTVLDNYDCACNIIYKHDNDDMDITVGGIPDDSLGQTCRVAIYVAQWIPETRELNKIGETRGNKGTGVKL